MPLFILIVLIVSFIVACFASPALVLLSKGVVAVYAEAPLMYFFVSTTLFFVVIAILVLKNVD